jgi:hypothetical protein
VSPYFHVLALFKSFQKLYFRDPAIFKSFPRKVHPILLIQELQATELKLHNNNYINQVDLISYYAITATNKRYSYPRVAAIQIDIHSVGKNLANMLHASHAQSAYGPRPYVSHMVNT